MRFSAVLVEVVPQGADFFRLSEDLLERMEMVWVELLDLLQLPVMPLPVQGRKAHVGAGAQSPADRLNAVRQMLREQLVETYVSLARDHGL